MCHLGEGKERRSALSTLSYTCGVNCFDEGNPERRTFGAKDVLRVAGDIKALVVGDERVLLGGQGSRPIRPQKDAKKMEGQAPLVRR